MPLQQSSFQHQGFSQQGAIPQGFIQQSYPPQIKNQGYVSQKIPQNFQQGHFQQLGSSLNQGYPLQGYNLLGSNTYG